MARSFFITRAAANSEDPTALEFWPAKGSDELHEALKEAFPFEANLTARMRAAVIEFLLQEQQAEQLTPISSEYLPSPQSSFVSTMPSPGTTSPQFQQDASQPRRQSAGQRSLQEGMDVWQLPNKPQAKVHTRRTMTSEEKKAYKQKRILGACGDCKRRRRKCEHNASVAGTSPVPQKVGKHKKRAPASIPTSKPEAAFDFSWSDPAFTFDNDLASMAMPVDSEMPSFELDTTEFDFTPDLCSDWQLFPDLSRTVPHVDVSPTWSSDYATFDSSTCSPRADLTQSRVSRDVAMAGMLNTHVFDSVPPGNDVFDAGVIAANAKSNTPMTPASLSPMSRTQSASGLLDKSNYDQLQGGSHSYLSASADVPIFSVGAQMDQSRVSPGVPEHSPLTPISLSPLSRSQSVNGLFGVPGLGIEHRPALIPAPNIEVHNYNSLPHVDSASITVLSPATTIRSSKLRVAASNSSEQEARFTNLHSNLSSQDIPNSSKDCSPSPDASFGSERHKESASLRSMTTTELYEGSPTEHSRLLTAGRTDSTSRSLPPSAPPRTQSTSSPSPSKPNASRLSTTSRLSFILDQEQFSTGVSFPSLVPSVQHREVLSAAGRNDNGSSRIEKSQPQYAQAQQTVMDISQFSGPDMSPNEWSLAQAPIWMVLYTSYNTVAQSCNGLAFITSFIISAMIVLSLSNLAKSSTKVPAKLLSSASAAFKSSWKTTAMGGLSSKLTPSTRWSSSHLKLLRATVHL